MKELAWFISGFRNKHWVRMTPISDFADMEKTDLYGQKILLLNALKKLEEHISVGPNCSNYSII